MAKHDWETLQADFLAAHAATGISVQHWCQQHGLNYQTARRHIKLRKTAQKSTAKTAQKKARQTAQNAASGETVQQDKVSDRQEENRHPDGSEALNDSAQTGDPETKPNTGRTKGGRFTEGNPHAKGNTGNPHPIGAFVQGNQRARKHGAYAKYLDADDLFDDAAEADLHDEQIFTRARALSVTRTLRKIHEDLAAAESVEARIELYDKLLKAESALDRNMARIESLENSLSRLRLDEFNGPRLLADTARLKAATAKLKAETQKITAENKEDITPLGQVVASLQSEATQNGILMGENQHDDGAGTD
ncbi:TPA: terminase [Yersinia enterocolitica]|nr:terminase [Yersinia enterocolitica]HEN3478662.1 terminase [Yersinia enterocolitica]